ncbi:TonB-dependent receptor plug domain-containing protein [Aureisphaera sp. CAU 1614]|uniref:TonB-dependent receptor plug domain-containing protein n=1 Tax=Halomarinibacterium sedimenti TaxID=2857106 RepID=A0A9X1K027_9FLAO|nr:TonB-dependent receptor plug domain-containing protein [Halomarinibacterium sedimenti]MBW2937966.1 TonB-dependent receptor plug domain-containing protein [Halomarinibacterium sedimenti]
MIRFLILILFTISISVNAQTETIIAWDISLSMKERDLEKEFDFITKYFERYQDTQVTVLQFNNVNLSETEFTITDGDWSAIKTLLESSQYNGATSYHLLNNIPSTSTTLLFTDGKENIERDLPLIEGTLYVVNGNKDHDLKNLQFLALANKGRFINLISTLPTSSNYITYTGTIFSESNEASEVVISVKGTNNSVIANKDGTYSIEAQPGDILVFSSLGLPPIEKKVTEDRNLNVWVKNDGIQLDQVFIKNKKAEKESNVVVKKERDPKTIGYAVSTVEEEDLNQGVSNISDATEGKFSGVTKGVNQDVSQSLIRGLSTISGNNYPLIIIDGAPIARSYSTTNGLLQLTDFIDPKNVADVTVLKGLAATNQYGSEGSNGVILIKTKMEAAREEAEKSGRVKKPDNFYEGKPIYTLPPTETKYLNEIKNVKDSKSAYNLFLNQREQFWNEPAYIIDLYNHFTPLNLKMAQAIGYNLLEREESKLSSLKGLLYATTQNKHYEMALDVATHLLEQYPEDAQSYLDLALAQKNAGNKQIALNMLLAIDNGTINPSINFTPLLKTVNNEIRNIAATKDAHFDLSKIGVKHLTKPNLDARIVVAWNNPNAEFELFFVNPSNLFYKWEHTNNNLERLQLEQLLGINQEEFEIEGSPKGQWLITVKYIGNRIFEDIEPTFLKYTVQYDYGKPTERTEEKVLRLSEKGSEYVLFKVNIN